MRYPLLFAIAFATAGCASLSHDLNQALETRTGVELVETPFFPQEIYQCGPAALATVLAANGIEVTPEDLVPAVYTPGRRGTLQQDLIGSTRAAGLLPYQIAPTLDALLDALDMGHPVLVLQNLGVGWWSQWHYAVVVGYQPDTRRLVLRSGTDQRRETRLDAFFNTWARSDYWGLVVLSPSHSAEKLDQTRYFQAIAALEAIGEHAHALAFWSNASAHWPKAPVPILGRANTLLALGRYRSSAALYEALLAEQQFPVVARNNLAFAQARLGLFAVALETLEQAFADPASAELLPMLQDTRAQVLELQHAARARGQL